jgi:hypothetical protein
MNILEKLTVFKNALEEEYVGDAIRVAVMWDDSIRLLSIGVEHPLYISFICDMRFLPKRNYDIILSNLYDQFKHDLDVVNERVRENYE